MSDSLARGIADLEAQNAGTREMGVAEAITLVQEIIARECTEERLAVLQKAASGVREAAEETKKMVAGILARERISVPGMTLEEAAAAIYRNLWGMGPLDDLYRDPEVDEICVLPDGKVFVVRRGKNEPTSIVLGREDIKTLIDRLIPYDEMGASLNESSPRLESVRPDNVRVTALCRPVAKDYCFTLRKHGTIDMTPEILVRLGTLDDRVWRILTLLARGRRNLLICGGVNSGKSTLLKMIIGTLDPRLSVRVLDTDNEVRASELYSERNILEMEEHPEVKAPMEALFQTTLRLTPDVIVVGEFRGPKEAFAAVQACIRGHMGMATAHFTDPVTAVWGTAVLLQREQPDLPFEINILLVARAFNFIIQMFTDSTRGVKKLKSITELVVEDDHVVYNDLVKWRPSTEDYLGPGVWEIVGRPSEASVELMTQYGVRRKEIEDVFGN
ncbi:MAG: ATPase, T2SS/T4P/T4SS family [Moorellaceae bacterium]